MCNSGQCQFPQKRKDPNTPCSKEQIRECHGEAAAQAAEEGDSNEDV
jgi:hypothetical protein